MKWLFLFLMPVFFTIPTTVTAQDSCCVDFRKGGGCWRKCDGKWKDVMASEEICRITDKSQSCYAEFRKGGGCWRKCNGKWKDLLPTEEACRVKKCEGGSITDIVVPPVDSSCCASFRTGGGCWRKCNGKWKDQLNESVCRDADPANSCYAEYRKGGGCWRKCNGKWKDLLPSEEACQIKVCTTGQTGALNPKINDSSLNNKTDLLDNKKTTTEDSKATAE